MELCPSLHLVSQRSLHVSGTSDNLSYTVFTNRRDKRGARSLLRDILLKTGQRDYDILRSIDGGQECIMFFKDKTDQLDTLLHWVNDHQNTNICIFLTEHF